MEPEQEKASIINKIKERCSSSLQIKKFVFISFLFSMDILPKYMLMQDTPL